VEDDDVAHSGRLGRLLIIGGAEDRCHGARLLERFVELCGGSAARIVLVTTATGQPDQVHADYERVFRRLGADHTIQLRLHGRSDADSDEAGATAMGRTMILGGEGPDVSAAAVRTGPGLGLIPKVLIDMHFGRPGPSVAPEHLGQLVHGDGPVGLQQQRCEHGSLPAPLHRDDLPGATHQQRAQQAELGLVPRSCHHRSLKLGNSANTVLTAC
jgi:hypothetical protein